MSWTCGRRTTDTRTPRAATASAAISEAARGFGWFGDLKWSSVAGWPGALVPIPVPEVTTKGRSEPASASPIASMARRSDLADLLEPREVVDEAEVDHPVRGRRAAPQAVQVLEVAAVHLGPGGGERRGALVRAGEAEHRVPRLDEVLDDRGADEAGGAGDENTHGEPFR